MVRIDDEMVLFLFYCLGGEFGDLETLLNFLPIDAYFVVLSTAKALCKSRSPHSGLLT